MTDPKIIHGHVGYSPDYRSDPPGPYSGTRIDPLERLVRSLPEAKEPSEPHKFTEDEMHDIFRPEEGYDDEHVAQCDRCQMQRRRDQTLRQQVSEFHRIYDQPIATGPSVPSPERVTLRLKLVTEEYFEFLAAMGVTGDWTQGDLRQMIETQIANRVGPVDLVEAADAMADLDYVVEGTRLELGIDGKPIADEVHRSNCSKLGADGKPVRNASGKVVKGPNFSAPNIAGELRKQGWSGQ